MVVEKTARLLCCLFLLDLSVPILITHLFTPSLPRCKDAVPLHGGDIQM